MQDTILDSHTASTETVEQEVVDKKLLLYEMLRSKFQSYDEIWIVGHKGDLAVNLQGLGLLDPDRQIDLVHVNRTLGVNAKIQIDPPEEAGESYEAITTIVNKQLEEQIKRIVEERKRTLVLYPYPVKGFQKIIEQEGAHEQFTLTAPVASHEAFMEIENKLIFAEIINEVLGQQFPDNIIKHIQLGHTCTLKDIRQLFGIRPDRAVYFQLAVSAGGDGTQRIEDQSEMDTLLTDTKWSEALHLGRIKATSAVEGRLLQNGSREKPYPANGTACIVPLPDGSCSVYLDPLSHKPVGLPELNAKEGAGVGNDWSMPYSKAIQEQYISIVTRIGKFLYEKFGYTGLFGPDCIVGVDESGQEKLYVSEINPRWQGTTPYQTMNALMNGRLPLEILHYAVKLLDPEELSPLLEEPTEYNMRSVGETGGFYMKVGGHSVKREVLQDMNGPWVWNSVQKKLIKFDGDISPFEVYTGSHNGIGEGGNLIWIKAPKIGEVVGGGLAPIGYVIGKGVQVFDSNVPLVTEDAYHLYAEVDERIYKLT